MGGKFCDFYTVLSRKREGFAPLLAQTPVDICDKFFDRVASPTSVFIGLK